MSVSAKIAEFQSLIVSFDNKALGLSAIAGVLLAILLPEDNVKFSWVGVLAIVLMSLAFLMSILVIWPRWHRERSGNSWYAIAKVQSCIEVASQISDERRFDQVIDLARILRIKAILLRLSIILLTGGILSLLIELIIRFRPLA